MCMYVHILMSASAWAGPQCPPLELECGSWEVTLSSALAGRALPAQPSLQHMVQTAITTKHHSPNPSQSS